MPPAKTKIPPLPVQWIRLDQLRSADTNPKRHDIEQVADSIRRHGYVDHGVLDLRTGQLIGGHGRSEALQAMHLANEQPRDWPCSEPGIHVDPTGAWWVPFATTTTRDENDAAALLVALNSGDRPGWDQDELATLLDELRQADPEIGLIGTGYTDDLVDRMLTSARDSNPDEPTATPVDMDETFEVVVTCADEADQQSLLTRLANEGLRVRAIVA